ncbi:metallophosphoesterase [Streptomyces glaucus]
MVEGSMTQGAGQGPEVERTATLRDFRVPAYVHETGPYVHSTHPGEIAPPPVAPPPPPVAPPPPPEEAYPEGYTPTQRDLPVINRGDTLQVTVDPAPSPVPQPATGPGPLYVVGDVHGYLDQLVAALQEKGLIDAAGHWCAGTARLWFLGDFTDRGPDGIGVIDLVMRLSAEAAAAGGYCKALMGNHELLLLGAKRFGDTPVNSGAGTATFQAAWLLNGGQKTDMDRLQDHHLQWMARLDALEEVDGHLLVHSDTTAYLDYGRSIEEVNDTVHETLTRNDADEVWDLFRKFTKRFSFRDEGGADAVRSLLDTYGGTRIVHGHSPIPYLLGEVGSEDGEDGAGPVVQGPHVYADGLAIAMDGGVTMAGKLLVQQLPLDV